MSQLPERYQAAIAPLINKAREFLEKGEELAAMAFVGNFTTGAVVPTPLFGRGPADKDVAARSVKMLAEQLNADFVFVLMEAYSLRADKVVKGNPIFPTHGNRKFPTRFKPRPLADGRGRLSTSLSTGTSCHECSA